MLAYPNVAGVHIRFGSGNTPVTMGFWKRFRSDTQEERDFLFLPISGIPTTLAQNRPREASPTGKSGIGVATYSIARQDVSSVRTMMYDTNPIYKGEGRLTTQAVVSPFASPQRAAAMGLLGPKFR